jgi:hypothetical protein
MRQSMAGRGTMIADGWDYRERLLPVSEMLDNGRCEPMKAAVHGVLMATVAVCAAYNTAAWLKRRQRHLAINAVIYCAAVWWERCHLTHHLRDCPRVECGVTVPSDLRDAA